MQTNRPRDLFFTLDVINVFCCWDFSHTCSMVRYIIRRKHLLLIPPIIAFRNKSESAWFLQCEGHLRHLKQTPRLAPYQPPPTARTEEEERKKISDFENGAANSTIIAILDNCGVSHSIFKITNFFALLLLCLRSWRRLVGC